MDNNTPAFSCTKLLGVALIAALLVPLLLLVAPRPASACSIWGPYVVEVEDLLADDFNQPHSDLVEAFNEYQSKELTTLTIDGAYVVETVSTIEPSGYWTRGSVSVMTQTWGETPRDAGPWVHATTYDKGETSCGAFHGPQLGRTSIRLVTSPRLTSAEILLRVRHDDAASLAVLADVFGEPVDVERDVAAEAELYGQLESQRPAVLVPTSIPVIGGRGLSVGTTALAAVAAVSVIGAGLFLVSRRRAD